MTLKQTAVNIPIDFGESKGMMKMSKRLIKMIVSLIPALRTLEAAREDLGQNHNKFKMCLLDVWQFSPRKKEGA